MPDSDAELLHRYATASDEAAFGGFVARHVRLVIGTAARKLGVGPSAEEVAQNVFAVAARKASRLSRHPAIPAWLHRAAVLESLKAARAEGARQRAVQALREEVDTMKSSNHSQREAWSAVRPCLDEALECLPSAARRLLLWRFFDEKSYDEIAALTGTNEPNARQRVSRAIRLLADRLRRRGVAVPAASLAPILAAEVGKESRLTMHATAPLLAARAIHRAGKLSSLSLVTHTLRIMAFNKARATVFTFAAVLLFGAAVGGFSIGWHVAAVEIARRQWEADAREARLSNVTENTPNYPPRLQATAEPRSVAAIVTTAVDYFADGDSLAARERGVLAVQGLFASEVPEALEILESRADLPEGARHAVAFHALALLAQSDARAALSLADTYCRGPARYGALFAIAQAWAPREPVLAWQWLLDSAACDEGLTQDNRGGIASVIAAAWARRDPSASVAAVLSSDTAWARSAAWGLATAVDDAWARPELLDAIIDAAGEPQGRQLLSDTVKRWARVDPEAAAEWVTRIEFPSADEEFRVLSSVAREWMDHDRPAAISWMLAHAPAQFKDALAAKIAEELSEESRRAR